MKGLKPHLVRLLLLTVGLYILIWVIRLAAPNLMHPLADWSLLFLFLLTLGTSSLTIWGANKYPKQFNTFFFVGMIIRFFAAIIYIVVVVLVGISAPLAFVGVFFVLYLCFQIFEITSLITNLRPHLEDRQHEDS